MVESYTRGGGILHKGWWNPTQGVMESYTRGWWNLTQGVMESYTRGWWNLIQGLVESYTWVGGILHIRRIYGGRDFHLKKKSNNK